MPERDPFTDFDAAYVFGALSPDDRSAYETHLATCAECRAAVTALAGLPGLLGRVPVEEVERPTPADVPASLLPRLLTDVARERRRARLRVAVGGLLAAACVIAAVVVAVTTHGSKSNPDAAAPTTTSASSAASSAPSASARTMRAIGNPPVEATVALQSVAWGTKIDMACTYTSASEPPQGPYGSGYTLRVIGRDGATSVLSNWKGIPGKTTRLQAGSQFDLAEIARVDIIGPNGQELLVLDL